MFSLIHSYRERLGRAEYDMDSSERRTTKVEVAIVQLDAAIQAWRNGEDIVAITLAGAADGIFGSLCRRQGIRTASEDISELAPLVASFEKHKERFNFLNQVINNLKHADMPEEDELVIAREDPLFAVVRGLVNSERLGIQDSPIMKECREALRLRKIRG
jgi:hypothetical protein